MRIRHFVGLLYLCILVTIVSFYMKNGYVDLGEYKYRAFKSISLAVLPVWLLLRIVDFIVLKEWKGLSGKIGKWRSGRIFILAFLAISVISMLTSNYRSQAVLGSMGWNMGLLTIIIMTAIYFITEDLFIYAGDELIKLFIAYCLLVVSAVLILGVMNRFSIFIKRPEGQAEDYISTLGNINWYCGYQSVWAGLMIGVFFTAKDDLSLLLRGTLVWICAMSFVCCGSDSAYLAWAAISAVSLFIVIGNADLIRRWAMMQAIAVSILPCIRLIGWIRPYRMWYGEWLHAATYGNAWIMPFILYTLMCYAVAFAADFLCRHADLVRAIIVAVPTALIVGLILVIILNSSIPGGIWPVRNYSIFYFGTDWGNGRGGIWKATILALFAMNPYYIFFGIGPDCYSSYIYSVTESAVMLRKQMGPSIFLTNAHCELLTMLINEGIFGLIAYAGIFIAHVRDAGKDIESGGLAMGVVLSLVAYLAVGTVGFMQILSTPFLFLILGMLAGLTNRFKLNTIK